MVCYLADKCRRKKKGKMRYIILNIDVAFILLMFGIIYKGFIIQSYSSYNYRGKLINYKYIEYGVILKDIGILFSIILGAILIAITYGLK